MVTRAPAVRNHLSADARFDRLRAGFSDIPDHRPGTPKIPRSDALMSAFAMFSLKSPSLLAFDQERNEDNLQQVDGIETVPCDSRRRDILDPVAPESLRPRFKNVLSARQRGKVLEEMVWIEGHYRLALDGTGYFSSQELHCASCLERRHRNGTLTSSHHLLGAVLIHPDQREVIPPMPEPIIKPDDTEKNDCERHAAKRLMANLRQDHPDLKLIVTEASRSSNAPHLRTLPDDHWHDIVGVKESDQGCLFEHLAAAEQAGRVTDYDREDTETGLCHRFRLVSDLPLNEANPDVRVNGLEGWEWDRD